VARQTVYLRRLAPLPNGYVGVGRRPVLTVQPSHKVSRPLGPPILAADLVEGARVAAELIEGEPIVAQRGGVAYRRTIGGGAMALVTAQSARTP
jgi:hypothetical protein